MDTVFYGLECCLRTARNDNSNSHFWVATYESKQNIGPRLQCSFIIIRYIILANEFICLTSKLLLIRFDTLLYTNMVSIAAPPFFIRIQRQVHFHTI